MRRRKRKLLPPDNRPDWRDENMGCFVTYNRGKIEAIISPKERQMYAVRSILFSSSSTWKRDPSYFWRKR